MKRRSVSQETAHREVIRNPTVITVIMVQRGEADTMIYGTIGAPMKSISRWSRRCWVIPAKGVHVVSAMNALLLPSGNTFYH
ncbi:MAG: phosphate acyltransferase [Symbiopectobacterium sp.]